MTEDAPSSSVAPSGDAWVHDQLAHGRTPAQVVDTLVACGWARTGVAQLVARATGASPPPPPSPSPFSPAVPCPAYPATEAAGRDTCPSCGRAVRPPLPDTAGCRPVLAGFGRRFVGHVLIDLPLGFLAAVAGSIALALSAAVATGSSLDTATARTVAQAGAVLGWTAYFWWGNHSGATVGKRAVGLRLVRTTTGRPPGLGRALIRVIGAQVSLSFIGMGYWNALWDRERQTWHDQMADTVVVRVGTGAAPAAGEAAPGVPAPGTLRTPEDRPPRGFARLSPTERVVAGW